MIQPAYTIILFVFQWQLQCRPANASQRNPPASFKLGLLLMYLFIWQYPRGVIQTIPTPDTWPPHAWSLEYVLRDCKNLTYTQYTWVFVSYGFTSKTWGHCYLILGIWDFICKGPLRCFKSTRAIPHFKNSIYDQLFNFTLSEPVFAVEAKLSKLKPEKLIILKIFQNKVISYTMLTLNNKTLS